MADSRIERRGLGRGLSALMADVSVSEPASQDPRGVLSRAPDRVVPVERLVPNPSQPRRAFDDAALDDLAASLAQKGVIQPLIVRPHPDREDHFEIVAGERRWRAAQRAQLHEVPVILRDFNDTEVLEVAIIENIQRTDLNAIEEAEGYRQLIERFGHTQAQMAEALGKSRSHIANLMRLLSLPEDVIEHLRNGRLSAGHARALITAENPSVLARQVIDKALSVRDTETLARGGTKRGQAKRSAADLPDADTRALEADLSAALGQRVRIRHDAKGAGAVTIMYKSLDELDDLCSRLSAAR